MKPPIRRAMEILAMAAFLLCVCNQNGFAQGSDSSTSDSLPKKKHRIMNTVRFNLTNPIIIGENSLVFGYERVLGPRQTLSVNFGQSALRDLKLLDVNKTNDEVSLKRNAKNEGFNFSIDYRFYLSKLNAFPAPRGVYVAPYYSYNHFGKQNIWSLNTASFQGDVSLDMDIDIHTGGVELGYQFIFWKRVALDFVLLGPGLANYKFSTKFETTLDVEDQQEIFDKINEYLQERFPGYSFAIDDDEFIKKGHTNTTSIGFRYMIHLGVRF